MKKTLGTIVAAAAVVLLTATFDLQSTRRQGQPISRIFSWAA